MTDTEARPSCAGHILLFDLLLDRPGDLRLHKEAARLCGTCPMRDEHLAAERARGGDDARWATGVLRVLARQKDAA